MSLMLIRSCTLSLVKWTKMNQFSGVLNNITSGFRLCHVGRMSHSSILSPRSWPQTTALPTLMSSGKLHTAGDTDLVNFLKDEIELEKKHRKSATNVKKIKGFEITKTDGPNVEFTKRTDNETIVISFNINNSVDEAGPETEPPSEGQEAVEPEMVSKPEFTVKITKASGKTLALQCHFPAADDVQEPEQEGDYDDMIEIEDIALLNKGEEWTDNTYTLFAHIMDGNLYDMLLRLLEERGIDAEFVDQLVEFSTAYEHNKYIGLLEQLKDFVAAK